MANDNVDDAASMDRIKDFVRCSSVSGVIIRTTDSNCSFLIGIFVDVFVVNPVIRLLTALSAVQPIPRALTAASAAELTTACACCFVVGFVCEGDGDDEDGIVVDDCVSFLSIGFGSGYNIDARDAFVLW